jgi:hypothetical protein
MMVYLKTISLCSGKIYSAKYELKPQTRQWINGQSSDWLPRNNVAAVIFAAYDRMFRNTLRPGTVVVVCL